jgi:hypothetical protein
MKKVLLSLFLALGLYTASANVTPSDGQPTISKWSYWVTKTGTFEACGRTYKYWVQVNLSPNPSMDSPSMQEYNRWTALRSIAERDCSKLVVYRDDEPEDSAQDDTLNEMPPNEPGEGDPF